MGARKKVVRHSPSDDPPTRSSSSSSDEQPLPTPTTKNPKPSSSESDTESGSQAESEPHVTPTKGKALAAEAQKPKAQSSPAPLISGSKRAAENNNVTEPKSAKRKSLRSSSTVVAAPVCDEKTEEDGKKSGDASKLRRWSKEAEITFMKGLVEFTSKTGMKLAASDALLLYMRGLLGDELSKNQLKDKVKTMKKKFERNAYREKNGDLLNFLKPHDRQVYDLSKKAWGNPQNEVVVEKPESDGNVAEGPQKKQNVGSSKKPKNEIKREKKSDPVPVLSSELKESEKMEIHHKLEFECIDLILSECTPYKEGNVLNEELMKRGWELIREPKRAELNARFKKLQDFKMELLVTRAELISDLTKLLAEALRSHN